MIIGIDPGLNCTGLAMLEGEQWSVHSLRTKRTPLYERVLSISSRILEIVPYEARVLVIEKPQVYQGHLQKGDPNDLINLALLVGCLLRIPAQQVMLPLPCQWKGQTPKHIHHKRIRERVPLLGRQSKDALDAVGLALYGEDHARP